MKRLPSTSSTALGQIDRERQRLLTDRGKELERFVSFASTASSCLMGSSFRRIRQANDYLKALDGIAASLNEEARKEPRYAISSMFLCASFRWLTADRYEQFHFVTGAEIGNTLILDQAVHFEHDRRTELGVTANVQSTHKALIRLEEFEHRLLATFHSHPSNGPSSTRPSGIDEAFQRRLESAGHLAVMAIFSRDGFIRFLRLDGKPQIEIYGKGVELHDADQSLYRLTDPYSA